jgi:subtilisin-like proprotein convertase family protein
MNPDGPALGRRYNANNVDLNRNFPDQFEDPVDSPAGRALEVQHLMNWGADRRSVLSANFHGGTVVANYPFDGTASGLSVYSRSPDDAVFISLARTYADANPEMYASNSDPSYDRGICNGSDWYVVYGGMQDWNYVWRGGKELTLEISGPKWPAASTLAGYWANNQESMLSYLERVHAGVRGIVTDASSGLPVQATVKVAGNGFPGFTDPAVGDYHRLLLPGTYEMEVSAVGYATAVVPGVTVEGGAPATRVDVALHPVAVDLRPISARVLDGPTGNGALDPGETSDVAVTLRNLGSAATGIVADLVPTTWHATVTRPGAPYPDMAAGVSGESSAPHHEVAVDQAVPAGHRLGFSVRWTSAEGVGESEPFFVPAGAAECSTVVASDVPKAVADRSSATSSLTFPSTRDVESVRVFVNVTHPYVGDLHVTLVSPSGTPVQLHARSGGSTDNVVAWYPTDRASADPLSRLVGEEASGTWSLEVHDGVPINTGTLNAWSLEVCGRPFEASTPEMRLREVERTAGGTVLTWWPYPGMSGYRVYRSAVSAPRQTFTDVTSQDIDPADTRFEDPSEAPLLFYLVTGIGPHGEGPK